MAKAAAREEQEMIDFEKALELQKQLDEREETDNIDWSIVAEQVQERRTNDLVYILQSLVAVQSSNSSTKSISSISL
ncbi:hypothetical protein Tco_0210035 [Tanacetum coccineum]